MKTIQKWHKNIYKFEKYLKKKVQISQYQNKWRMVKKKKKKKTLNNTILAEKVNLSGAAVFCHLKCQFVYLGSVYNVLSNDNINSEH